MQQPHQQQHMYSIVEYNNYRKEIDIIVHGVTTSREKAVNLAKKMAEKTGNPVVAGDSSNNSDFSLLFQTVLDSYQIADCGLTKHVWMGDDKKRGIEIVDEFVAAEGCLFDSQEGLVDFINIIESEKEKEKCSNNSSGSDSDGDSDSGCNNPRSNATTPVAAVTLADVVKEILLPTVQIRIPGCTLEETTDNLTRNWEAVSAQLEARGFNLRQTIDLHGTGDTKTDGSGQKCKKRAREEEEEEEPKPAAAAAAVADERILLNLLAFLWRHGGEPARNYFVGMDYVTYHDFSSRMFAVMKTPVMD